MATRKGMGLKENQRRLSFATFLEKVMQETDTQYQNVYEQLKIDEGVKYEIYEDHLGYPTLELRI